VIINSVIILNKSFVIRYLQKAKAHSFFISYVLLDELAAIFYTISKTDPIKKHFYISTKNPFSGFRKNIPLCGYES